MQRLALLVGVNHYADERINDLNCCTQDAQEVAFSLRHHLGFDEAVVLTDGVSTERVMERLAALGRKLKPGDLFVFFFAGHGKTHEPRGEGRDQLFLLRTANVSLLSSRALTGAPGILSWHALKALTDAWEGVQRLFIFDACRLPLDATRGDHLAYDGEAVFRDLALRRRLPQAPGNGAPLAVFNSCPDGAQAEELPQHGHGRFTAALLQEFQEVAQARAQLLADATLAARVHQRMKGLGVPALAGHGPQEPMWVGDAVLLRSAPPPALAPEPPPPPPAPPVPAPNPAADVLQLLADFERQLAAGQHHSPWHDCCQTTLGKLQAAGLAHATLEAMAQRMVLPQAPTDVAAAPTPPESIPAPPAEAPAPASPAFALEAEREPEVAQEPEPQAIAAPAVTAAPEPVATEAPAPRDPAPLAAPPAPTPVSGSEPTPTPTPEPSSSTARTSRWLPAGGVALALVAAGAWWQQRTPSPPPAQEDSTPPKAPAPASRFRTLEPLLQVPGCEACGEASVFVFDSFAMGSPAIEPERSSDEGPVHTVRVASFEIGRTEVTQGQWKAVMGSNPSHFSACGDACPVENVSWQDITGPNGFLARLNQKLGLSGSQAYRLPSEAEWEFATHAGSSTPFWWGASIHPGQANYDGNVTYAGGGQKGEYRQKTVKADAFEPNPWGLYNVHGNVWEWVQDCYEEDYRQGQPIDGTAHRAQDPACEQRVLRGGSWIDIPQDLRSANRNGSTPDNRGSNLGFRIARTF